MCTLFIDQTAIIVAEFAGFCKVFFMRFLFSKAPPRGDERRRGVAEPVRRWGMDLKKHRKRFFEPGYSFQGMLIRGTKLPC